MQTFSVPIIMGLVYGIVEMLKACIKNEKFNNFIPLIAGILGAILGVVGFYTPNAMSCSNILEAILIGMGSGLSATGSNQLFKQIKEFQETSKIEKLNVVNTDDNKTNNDNDCKK